MDGYHGVGLITLGSNSTLGTGATLGSVACRFGGIGGIVGIGEVGGGVTGLSVGDTGDGGCCEFGFGTIGSDTAGVLMISFWLMASASCWNACWMVSPRQNLGILVSLEFLIM